MNNNHEDIKALFLNCSLKQSPQLSHTDNLIEVSVQIMKSAGAKTEVVRVVDHNLAPGVALDMSEDGFPDDTWPIINEKIKQADILIMATPIWLGEESSVARRVIERLMGSSSQTNDKGQLAYYGKVGGCLMTGNEDGYKHTAMTLLYAMQHLGFTIPPQTDCAWVGEAGPGKSYGEDGAGKDNAFTQKLVTFMTWNTLHMAKMLKDSDGISRWGTSTKGWKDGENFDHPSPENFRDQSYTN